jgi:hypothetical protein
MQEINIQEEIKIFNSTSKHKITILVIRQTGKKYTDITIDYRTKQYKLVYEKNQYRELYNTLSTDLKTLMQIFNKELIADTNERI